MKNKNIREFDKLDTREFEIIRGINYKIILFQIDILRLINLCESVNSKNLAKKLKRIIYIKDYLENTKTSFDRDLPKGEVESYCLSPKENLKLKMSRHELDQFIELYYTE